MPGLSFGLWALDKDDGVLVCTVSFWDVVDMVFQSVPNLVNWLVRWLWWPAIGFLCGGGCRACTAG